MEEKNLAGQLEAKIGKKRRLNLKMRFNLILRQKNTRKLNIPQQVFETKIDDIFYFYL